MKMRIFGMFCFVMIAVGMGVFIGEFVFQKWSPSVVEEVVVEEAVEEVVVEETVEEVVDREEILASDPPGPYPVLSGGAVTWQDAYVTALDWTEYADALFYLGCVDSWEHLAYLAESGSYDEIRTLKKGTRIINSYYKDGKIRFVEETLKKDRLVLWNDKNKAVVLVSCGNPIKVLPPPPPPPAPPKVEKPTVTISPPVSPPSISPPSISPPVSPPGGKPGVGPGPKPPVSPPPSVSPGGKPGVGPGPPPPLN
jgi:hypothetical protein